MNQKFDIKNLILGVLFFVALGALPCAAQEKKEKDLRQEKLFATRQAWYDAFCRGDTEEMARIEAKDFLVIAERDVQTREEQLRGIRRRVEEKKWMPKGAIHVTDEVRVRFYGNSAVVTGRGWMKFPDQKDPPTERSVLTEVWVERDGEWSVVHLHFHQIDRP